MIISLSHLGIFCFFLECWFEELFLLENHKLLFDSISIAIEVIQELLWRQLYLEEWFNRCIWYASSDFSFQIEKRQMITLYYLFFQFSLLDFLLLSPPNLIQDVWRSFEHQLSSLHVYFLCILYHELLIHFTKLEGKERKKQSKHQQDKLEERKEMMNKRGFCLSLSFYTSIFYLLKLHSMLLSKIMKNSNNCLLLDCSFNLRSNFSCTLICFDNFDSCCKLIWQQ